MVRIKLAGFSAIDRRTAAARRDIILGVPISLDRVRRNA
jgi:hypothetical protein